MNRLVVLGVGKSASLYVPHRGDYVIGCNDAMRFAHCDLVVCLDSPEKFSDERKGYIMQAPHLRLWRGVFDLWEHKFKSVYSGSVSNNSAYVALNIALGTPIEVPIHIFGVDIYGHPNIGHGSALKWAMRDFQRLRNQHPSRYIYGHGDGLAAEIFKGLCQS